ncbi:MAG: hypothetical protein Q9219_003732 [cf. Caloplaca sp. 3 TL-2023]
MAVGHNNTSRFQIHWLLSPEVATPLWQSVRYMKECECLRSCTWFHSLLKKDLHLPQKILQAQAQGGLAHGNVVQSNPKIATHHRLFLGSHATWVTWFEDVDRLQRIYRLTTLLLVRITSLLSKEVDQSRPPRKLASLCDRLEHEKFIAKLNRIIKYLRISALEAPNFQGLESLEDDDQQRCQRWSEGRQLDYGWFSEWPNGRRPLSTTWPWNIRPSLVVLWGVCWMFYDNNTRSAQELRQQLEDEEVASSVWARPAPQSATPSQPSQRKLHTFTNFHNELTQPE